MKPSALSFRAALRYWVFLTALLVTLQAPALLAQDPEDDHDDHEDIVKFSTAELEEFGVVVTEAGPATMERVLDLPGEIQANDNHLAHIVPRFAGIVTDVKVQVGDEVTAGQVLAVIESDGSLSTYEMKTLISGTVIDKHITLGEAVSRQNGAFIVADLSTVWVDITVYQRDIPLVATGQKVFVSGGHGLPRVTGKISYVSPVVEEETRTSLARVLLPNPDGTWRPGTFITAKIIVDIFEVPLAVPRTALQTFEGKTVVFVETAEGFVPRAVTLGKSGRDEVEIVTGLSPGERYVSLGGFTLKAELGKGSFGGGHNH